MIEDYDIVCGLDGSTYGTWETRNADYEGLWVSGWRVNAEKVKCGSGQGGWLYH